MDTSICHDDINTMKSGQSNLLLPLDKINLMISSCDSMTEVNPETLENQVTAVSAYLLPRTTSHQGNQSSTRPNPKKYWVKVLLDSGSNSDLLFMKKGSKTYIPSCRRQIPLSWSTSAGTFKTEKVGKVDINFCEFNRHTTYHEDVDIVEYTKKIQLLCMT